MNDCLEQTGKRPLVLDFAGVAFMNSSAMMPIIAIIKRAGATGRDLEMRFREDSGWQRISYESLRVLCDKIPNVQPKLVKA